MNLDKLNAAIMQNGSALYGETAIRINTIEFKTRRGRKASFMVVIPKRIAGERLRKQFKTLPDAAKWIESWLKQRETTAATAAEAADFNVNLPRLRAAGVGIGELLNFYERRFVGTDTRKTLKELQGDLERMLEKSGKKKRPRYLDMVKSYGKNILDHFGEDTTADAIRPKAAFEWIIDMEATGKTRRHYWNHFNRLLSRAVSVGALKEDCLKEYQSEDVDSALEHETADPEILTNDQVSKLLNFTETNSRAHLPLIVLGLFAGLRQSEARQISWEQINLETGFVTVPKTIAKGRFMRHAKLTGRAVEWLKLCERTEGKLAKGSLAAASIRFSRFVKKAGFKEWPHNALRHTHASNYYALHGADKTRLQIGHTAKNEEQLFTNYRALVHEADAKKFFKIAPPKQKPGKTIPFPKAANA